MQVASERDVVCRLLFALASICWLVPLWGATLEQLSLDDMIEKSSAIVRGRVTGSWAAFSGPSIFTHYRVQVTERWKGPADATVEFVVPGGRVDRVRQVCSGAPELLEGKEYVLFLWASRAGVVHIIGLTQGLFELPAASTGEALAVRPASSEVMLEAGTGRAVTAERIEMRVRELSSRISANLSRGARK